MQLSRVAISPLAGRAAAGRRNAQAIFPVAAALLLLLPSTGYGLSGA